MTDETSERHIIMNLPYEPYTVVGRPTALSVFIIAFVDTDIICIVIIGLLALTWQSVVILLV